MSRNIRLIITSRHGHGNRFPLGIPPFFGARLITSKMIRFSDAEIEEDEEDEPSPEVIEAGGKNKRTGKPLMEIKINAHQVQIPPVDYVTKLAEI